ncbi:hypothetical protein CBS101457_002747 [Exobasidium rhododendri]|nr:hypothetical protein CBS101457_002747 [Exobasidium rhododendri]
MDTRKLVRRAERDPWNRLNSILEDADWVNSFCASKAPHLPIIPNLRCGAWYVAKEQKGCYFKSTDGHTTQWDFSLKRYNLDLVHTIQERGGCVIVDSTRRGKSMPDALSKTVPIWCAVMNAASNRLYGTPEKSPIRLPNHVVSASEESQIVAKMEEWIDMLLTSDLSIAVLKKPLRPLFVTRSQHDEEITRLTSELTPDHYPIVLISASQMVPTPGLEPMQTPVRNSSLALSREIETLRQKSRYIYVQGSGDDEEMWSNRLTPSLFWNPANMQRILSVGSGEELEKTLQSIVDESRLGSVSLSKDIELDRFNIFFGTRQRNYVFSQTEKDTYRLIVHTDALTSSDQDPDNSSRKKCRVMQLNIPSGKKGLSAFRAAITTVVNAARSVLPGPLLVCSQESGLGNDLNGGFVISILASCFDENRNFLQTSPDLTKDDVRRRLQWMTSLLPNLTPPSRGHLLRINEILLSGPYRDHDADTEGSQSLVGQMAALSSR